MQVFDPIILVFPSPLPSVYPTVPLVPKTFGRLLSGAELGHQAQPPNDIMGEEEPRLDPGTRTSLQ